MNKVAYKSNYLIEASYKFTLQEQRLLLACISKINPSDDNALVKYKTISLTAKDFYLAFPEMGIENAERELKRAINKIAERWISIKAPEKTEEFRWVQKKVTYHKGEGKISITFSDDVMPYLTQLKGFFTKIAVKNVSSLKSAYSIRMYELLMQFIKTGERLITIDDFRKIMAVEDKYAQFKELNKFVVKSSITELNKKSNLMVTYDAVKNGRIIVALHFHVKENKQITIN